MPGVRAMLLPVAIATALLGASSSAARVTSGLHGTVTRGPIMPACNVGTPCDEPAAGVTLTFVHAGAVAGRVRTGDAGGYRILLSPGLYTVRVRPVSKLGRVDPTRVRVLAGRVRHVDFAIDTGIR